LPVEEIDGEARGEAGLILGVDFFWKMEDHMLLVEINSVLELVEALLGKPALGFIVFCVVLRRLSMVLGYERMAALLGTSK
jgi:hypothetical protein